MKTLVTKALNLSVCKVLPATCAICVGRDLSDLTRFRFNLGLHLVENMQVQSLRNCHKHKTYHAGLSSWIIHHAAVGRTSSLHYYYLALVVLILLLAHYIAVNTSYRSYGYNKPGHTSRHYIKLGYSEKVRNTHFLLQFVSRSSSHSIESRPIS
jgi:hypothetical protein